MSWGEHCRRERLPVTWEDSVEAGGVRSIASWRGTRSAANIVRSQEVVVRDNLQEGRGPGGYDKTMDETRELQFPVECHFRVIAENRHNMHFVIETVVMGLGITSPVERSHTSDNDRYVSFRFSTVVESREQMARIDRELRLIEGVRMVL